MLPAVLPRVAAAFWLASCLVVAGCGYRLAGSEAGLATRTLWVAPVEDESDEILFGATLAKAVAREAVNRADVVLVGRPAAEMLLSIRVDSVTATGVAFTAGDRVREYTLVGVVTATLENPGGEIIWRGVDVRADREFAAGDTVNETEANKDQALILLAKDLSREVLRRATLKLAGAGT